MSKIQEIEYIYLDEDEAEEIEVKQNQKTTKGKITSERVKAQGGGYIKGLHKQMRDGKCIGYIADFCYGYSWIIDDKTGKQIKKQDKQRKSFTNKKAAEKWLKEQAAAKADMEDKGRKLEKYGYTVSDVCDMFHDQLVKDGNDEGYIHDHDARMKRFKKYFVREDNKYVKRIDTAQIQEYLDYEATRPLQNGKIGMCESSVMKYKSTLKMMWDFMLGDRYRFQVFQNIVTAAKVKAKPSEFESVALTYDEIEEMIECIATYFEDPTYLFLFVMAYTQGMRRGEICGLKYGDVNLENRTIIVRHNRVQRPVNSNGGTKNTDKDNVKLPKRNKIRRIELHKAGYEMMKLYKEWQEQKLGRPVNDDDFVLMFEINLKYGYIPHSGKISRKWAEMYTKINKLREKARKEPIRYARLHDGRETYATLLLHSLKKEDGTIIPAADNRQVYESMGHDLPEHMKNTTESVYNKQSNERWDITRFWDSLLTVSVADTWNFHQQLREIEDDMLSDFDRKKKEIQKEKRFEKAKRERDAANEPEEIIVDYLLDEE